MNRKRINLVELYSPDTEIEVLLVKSILTEAGIDFFIQNDTFGSLTVGPRIALYNKKTVFVAADQKDEARSLIRDLHDKTEVAEPPAYTLGDKLRMVAEFFLFGWIMPGRRRRPEPEPPQLELLKTADPDPALDSSRESRRPRLRLIRGGRAKRRRPPD